ncbi:MAG TPA: YtxH domain-containing protein [Terriglobales bacterium]|jgi:gas vesicle protein|nr:YtxH domain-containing protein [Terriglobales bacterium]
MKKEKMLRNLLIGTGVYLLESLRDRAGDKFENISDIARDTYEEASRRASRATEAIQGNDTHYLSTTAALLIGVGVGVGVGLLLAPSSGEETRGSITNKVQEFGDRVRDKFNDQKRESGSASYGT